MTEFAPKEQVISLKIDPIFKRGGGGGGGGKDDRCRVVSPECVH